MSLFKIAILLLLVAAPSLIEGQAARIAVLTVCYGTAVLFAGTWVKHDTRESKKGQTANLAVQSGMVQLQTRAQIIPVLANQLKDVTRETASAAIQEARR